MIIRGREGDYDIFNLNLNIADIKTGEHLEENKIKTAKAIEDIAKNLAEKYNLTLHVEQSSPKTFFGSGILYGGSGDAITYHNIRLRYVYRGNKTESIKKLPKECIDADVLPAFLKKIITLNGFTTYEVFVCQLEVESHQRDELYKEAIQKFYELAITPRRWIRMRREKENSLASEKQ